MIKIDYSEATDSIGLKWFAEKLAVVKADLLC